MQNLEFTAQGTTRIPRLKITKCGGHIIPKTAMDILLEILQRIRLGDQQKEI